MHLVYDWAVRPTSLLGSSASIQIMYVYIVGNHACSGYDNRCSCFGLLLCTRLPTGRVHLLALLYGCVGVLGRMNLACLVNRTVKMKDKER